MHVGALDRHSAAWIDDDDARAALCASSHQPLKQHGMTPGKIGADEHDQIRFFKVLVCAGHRIRAERPDVSGNG